jgi:diguanylate cyclase (GGDEF)-like protein
MTFPELMAGLSGQVITSGEPILSRHPGDGLEPPETIARRRAAGSGSLIVIPLATPSGAIGTLTAHNRVSSRVFSGRDVDLLMALARQAAAAIQNAQLAEDVRRLARVDSLTGLLTRYESLRSAERDLKHCQRRGQPVSLLMWDIDFFKRVNDTYGHMTGDEVLRGLGAVFSRLCRPYDIMGRIGGEEFFGFFPESPLPVGQMIAERLRAGAASQSFDSSHGSLSVTVSVGVVATGDADVSLQTLMGRADWALYRSKSAGRNCVTVWEADRAQ